jgi:hypothetical protein
VAVMVTGLPNYWRNISSSILDMFQKWPKLCQKRFVNVGPGKPVACTINVYDRRS